MSAPLTYAWDGEAFAPLPRFAKHADKEFVIGQNYRLEVQEERSAISHRHYFASLHEAWLNLPEVHAERFATEEHLRKYALIKAGYRDERSIVCASKAEAQRVAAFIRPMDEYAIVTVHDATVIVYTAKSQSSKAMGKQAFQESKQAVLDIVSQLIGVPQTTLEREGQRAA